MCQKCKSERLCSVYGKSADCSRVEIGNVEHLGYIPYHLGVGGGDDIEFVFCMDCGQLQGKFPLPVHELEQQEE